MPDVSIIILTWNGLRLTKQCLESLSLKKLPPSTKVIVVDNGSVDGTVEYLRSVGEITLIENGKNLGYSKAVNIGIRAAAIESDIILLNNDATILQPDWIEILQSAAYSDDKVGIVGAKILKQDTTIQHCGAYLPLDTLWGQQIAGGEVDVGQYAGIHEVESVVFACAYIKRSTIERIGLLSEEFFAYFEDTDYCLRATIADLKITVCGDVFIRHAENSSTKINKISHNTIFLDSQRQFKNKWKSYLDKSRYTVSLDWHSIANFPSGYAFSSRNLMFALDEQNVKLAYKYVYGPGSIYPVSEKTHSEYYILNILRSREFGAAEKQVVYAQGDVFEKNSGKYKIGFTMLEVDGLPAEWVRQANMMDEIWVPSNFNVTTFRNSGVKPPIYTIPLGINPAYFSTKIKKVKSSGSYTFLSVFEWGERKAPEILLKAFSDEFAASEDVQLLCKINNFDGSINLRSEIQNLRLRPNGGTILIAENEILKDFELPVLYRSVDCFVLPTRGEGWGMPILEAMACGLPVIATAWSSQTDFMNKENSLPLEVENFIPAVAKCPYYDGFKWANPSYEHLRKLMRWAYENSDDATKIGLRAAEDAERYWTWQQSAKLIKSRIN